MKAARDSKNMTPLNVIYDVSKLRQIMPSTSLIEKSFHRIFSSSNNESIKDSINHVLAATKHDFGVSLSAELCKLDEIAEQMIAEG